MTDFGDVTLACADDQRLQAHEDSFLKGVYYLQLVQLYTRVYLATGSVGSSVIAGSTGVLHLVQLDS